jgi:hypothetical protein
VIESRRSHLCYFTVSDFLSSLSQWYFFFATFFRKHGIIKGVSIRVHTLHQQMSCVSNKCTETRGFGL